VSSMSSKVLLPGDPRVATSVNWRQVGSSGCVASAAPSDFPLQLEQLQRESEQRIREAHAAGTREGEAAGRGRAAAELQPVIDRLARSMDELAGLRARLRSE